MTATQEVDVMVVVPPSGRVRVKVCRTGADVVLVPEVMVSSGALDVVEVVAGGVVVSPMHIC